MMMGTVNAVTGTQLETIAWSRGAGCSELAGVLTAGRALRADGDLQAVCETHKVDLLVMRRMTSFDLVPVAVPKVDRLDVVESVTAAVGLGPHSPLAADVAARIAAQLEIPAELATVVRDSDDTEAIEERIDELRSAHSDMTVRLARGDAAVELLEGLDEHALLVVGAPGGSWFHRQIYGPGHRLAVATPGGSIVVRSAPRRCFHEVEQLHDMVVGPQLSVADALRVIGAPAVPVAEDGRLVGMVRRSRLSEHPDSATVGSVMEPPVSVASSEPLEAVADLHEFLDYGPVPVVDRSGRLVGAITNVPLGGGVE